MKNIAPIFKSLLIIISIIGSFSTYAQDADFHVYFRQNGKDIVPKKNTVTLIPAEFDIIIEFKNPNGVHISCSFEKTTYKMAAKGNHLNELPGFTAIGMADYKFNPEQQIMIKDSSANYWFYDNEDEHRFNNVTVTENKIIGTRTISNVYMVDTKETIQLSDISDDMYLVFLSYTQTDYKSEKVEVHREYYKLKWTK